MAQTVKRLQCGRPGFSPWIGKISWRRRWQPTPVFLPGKFHRWRSLVGYSPWGCRVRHDWVTSLSLVPGLEVRKCQPRVSGTEWSPKGRNRLQPLDRCQDLWSTGLDLEAIKPRSSRAGLSVCHRVSRAGSDFLVTDCLPIAFPVQGRIPRSPQPHACPLQPPEMLIFLLIL